MDWTQLVVFYIGVAGLWLWQRSESASDRKELRAAIDENKRETTAILQAIQEEIKDFHGRLCAIEERNRANDIAYASRERNRN